MTMSSSGILRRLPAVFVTAETRKRSTRRVPAAVPTQASSAVLQEPSLSTRKSFAWGSYFTDKRIRNGLRPGSRVATFVVDELIEKRHSMK